MRPLFERLASRYQLVFHDKRGVGVSEREREDFSLADELADLEVVVDEVTKGPIAMFGSSQGGPLSIAYEAAHPERVTHLVLYGAYESGAAIARAPVRDSFVSLVRAREIVAVRDVPLFALRAERRAWDERAHRRFIQNTRSA
jgi:pimeloyl-ACP methyl ester carboxylesterase